MGCFSFDEIAPSGWLTPYRADALTLTTVASGQWLVVSCQWKLTASRGSLTNFVATSGAKAPKTFGLTRGPKGPLFHSSSPVLFQPSALSVECSSALVLFGNRARHVDDRQQHEHVRLQDGDHDVQAAEDDRDADRDHRKENQRDQVAGENVGPETNRQREQTREMA